MAVVVVYLPVVFLVVVLITGQLVYFNDYWAFLFPRIFIRLKLPLWFRISHWCRFFSLGPFFWDMSNSVYLYMKLSGICVFWLIRAQNVNNVPEFEGILVFYSCCGAAKNYQNYRMKKRTKKFSWENHQANLRVRIYYYMGKLDILNPRLSWLCFVGEI